MKNRIWAGRILSGLGVAFLIFDIGVLWTVILFPSYVGLFLWGGLCYAMTFLARG